MNREEYLSHQLDRVYGRGDVFTSRDVYLYSVRRDINSEVPPCPNSQSSRGIIPAYNVMKDNLRSINILTCVECGYEIHYFPSQQDRIDL